MKNITDIFFDLDHTLWDFDQNAAETLTELYAEMELVKYVAEEKNFIQTYKEINARYWNLYNHGKITKAEVRNGRFVDLMNHFEIPQAAQKASFLGKEYIHRCPQKTNIFPNAHETLAYLGSKYSLHIITNGFREAQSVKLACSKLDQYFDLVLCSEDVGVNKPHPKVFETALERTQTKSSNAVMIGDNPETDILGAQNCEIQTILFNPHQEKHTVESVEIQDLKQLTDIFG